MKPHCPVCEIKSVFIDQINGYVEGMRYNIYQCNTCGLQFAEGDKSGLNYIYDSIYKHSSKIAGYDRYVKYFNEIITKRGKKAIDYLISQEDTYYYIYNHLISLKNCRDLRVLEVGSGLGYFTYALSEDGFNIIGIDLSKDAVKKSTAAFGNLYKAINFTNLYEKYDIIILTEVIEHVSNPINFLSELKKLLLEDGQILLTTPRKQIQYLKSIWLTELPPVHLFWFTTLSLQRIGQKMGLKFFEISVHYKDVIFDSRINDKPSLDSDYLPKLNIYKVSLKAIILQKSPLFIKRIYYKWFRLFIKVSYFRIVKKSNLIITNEHSTIFFGYKF